MTFDHKSPYAEAGVSIESGNHLIDTIKPLVKATHRPEVLGNIGGFGALFNLDTSKYQQPVLVSGTDGVGTKLMLAKQLANHQYIGIDLVAMCVNDIVTLGAEPLFFLDYYATSRLDVSIASTVIAGIAAGCKEAGCALVGGETAEMPGLYQKDDYDLAGFCVGVVEKNRIIDGSAIKNGDSLIALTSSGIHSNGYSLVRKIINDNHIALDQPFNTTTLGDVLLTPTKIYTQQIAEVLAQIPVNGIAHITGGGLTENIPRIIPQGLTAVIDRQSWRLPTIFEWLQQTGQLSIESLLTTFNCGVGMVLIVNKHYEKICIELLHQLNEQAWSIGRIECSHNDCPLVYV